MTIPLRQRRATTGRASSTRPSASSARACSASVSFSSGALPPVTRVIVDSRRREASDRSVATFGDVGGSEPRLGRPPARFADAALDQRTHDAVRLVDVLLRGVQGVAF